MPAEIGVRAADVERELRIGARLFAREPPHRQGGILVSDDRRIEFGDDARELPLGKPPSDRYRRMSFELLADPAERSV
ncbi:hypothetical protein ACFR95_11245 [Halolamina salifodinae]|uniref:hypothetical protein n=1 Tax=Halolamina salifodinae TaxID=1202767 RepID=UPI0036332CEC